MVDTVRTLTALQALFADNTAGDIDEQDLRDFLVTSLMVTDAQSPTTANVTAAIGKHYELDISGLTADRNFILPTAAVGDRIRVKLMTDAPATYELIIKGAATVTINGGSPATEWSRLFIDNEVVEFRATSSTNWDVVNDGRNVCLFRYEVTTPSQELAVSTFEKLTDLDTKIYDDGNLWDSANNRIIPRRMGKYAFVVTVTMGSQADQNKQITALYKNGTQDNRVGRSTMSSPGTDVTGFSGSLTSETDTLGDYFEVFVYSSSTNASSNIQTGTHLHCWFLGD